MRARVLRVLLCVTVLGLGACDLVAGRTLGPCERVWTDYAVRVVSGDTLVAPMTVSVGTCAP